VEVRDDPAEGIKLIGPYILILTGIAVIGAGLVLGYITFNRALSYVDDPAPIAKWIDLRDNIHSKSIITPDGRRRNIPARQSDNARMYGGYFMTFLSILFLWVLARISLAFISRGGAIMSAGC
jgi:hypothetical protein